MPAASTVLISTSAPACAPSSWTAPSLAAPARRRSAGPARAGTRTRRARRRRRPDEVLLAAADAAGIDQLGQRRDHLRAGGAEPLARQHLAQGVGVGELLLDRVWRRRVGVVLGGGANGIWYGCGGAASRRGRRSAGSGGGRERDPDRRARRGGRRRRARGRLRGARLRAPARRLDGAPRRRCCARIAAAAARPGCGRTRSSPRLGRRRRDQLAGLARVGRRAPPARRLQRLDVDCRFSTSRGAVPWLKKKT